MRHVCRLLFVAPLVVALTGVAQTKETVAAALGKKVDAFSLQDFRGKQHALADAKDAKLVVIAFLGVECPLSKLYAPRLAELAGQYESKGVVFLGIDSNRQDSVTEMAQFAKVHELKFPLLKDLNNVAGRSIGRGPQPASVRARCRSQSSLRRAH